MSVVMSLRFTVTPDMVKKSWVSRECSLSEFEKVSNKLADLGIKHCLVVNEWGNLDVYVPATHLYNLITVINSY